MNNGRQPVLSALSRAARSYRVRVRRLVIATGLGAALLAGACSSPGSAPGGARTGAGSAATTVEISVSHCGQGWTAGRSGWQAFTLRDSDSRAAEVTLVDPTTGAVFASLDPLGPGRTASLSVQLAPGRYAFRCALEDEPVVTGPTVTVTGPAVDAPPGVLPVTEQDLLPATKAYEGYVTSQLPGLLRGVQRLSADVARGSRSAAERDWLTAHLAYERLGAAYGAFGDVDAEINGLPSGLPNGVRDTDFTGFHRIEYGLWHGQPLGALRAPAGALVRSVTALRAAFPTAQIDPLDVSIRAHEITENALQFELTGRTDFGSHSALATVAANLDGTRTVLAMLTPLLRARYPALDQTLAALHQAQADLAAQDRRGHWTAARRAAPADPRAGRLRRQPADRAARAGRPDPRTPEGHVTQIARRQLLRWTGGAAAGSALGAAAVADLESASAATLSATDRSGRAVPRRAPGRHHHAASGLHGPRGVRPDRAQPGRARPTCSQTLTDRARFLTAGGPPPNLGISAPPSDSGVLGPVVPADGLTVTVGARRLAVRRPVRPAGRSGRSGCGAMDTFPDDDLDRATCATATCC